MNKRQSGNGNTLFNYFTRSPSVSNSNNTNDNSTNLENETPKKTKEKRPLDISHDEEDVKPTKRRKRIIADSDSSDNEGNDIKEIVKSTPVKKETTTKKDIPLKNGSTNGTDIKSEENNEFVWLHNKLDFLKPNRIRDKNGKRPNDPDYDSRTLCVPSDFLSNQTPAMRQWWIMKSQHFDCVLMFKVGKFYELYHMDAVTGVNELGFSFMKGEFAHSGFPESAYGRMVGSLVELGYKVARVEQTETPDAMADRARKGDKNSKVVRREICQITSRATRVHGLQDLELKQPWPCYLLAISEDRNNDDVEFGVCFVDTSIGTFHIGQFKDDACHSRLLTLLIEYSPALILEERKQLSVETKSILRTALSDVHIESLNSETQFYSSSKTLKLLLESEYFKGKGSDDIVQLPSLLQSMISESDPLNMTCKKQYDLGLQCLGACVWYLQDCLLDIQLLSLGKFELYTPSDMSGVKTAQNKYMVLDAYAMQGLNILGENASLQKTLDYCCTPLGKRLLHQWICRPVCDVEEIINRQQAISELIRRPELMQSAREMLSKLPDLERHLSRIHSMGNAARAKNHPDSRAIFYEERIYSKNKIHDFMTTLNGFERGMSICDIFTDVSSSMLKKHVCIDPKGIFPDMSESINFFKTSFDAEEAEKKGKIIPQYGIDVEYDSTVDGINNVQKKLDKYLENQKKFFGCSVSYHGTDKKRYQLDIPDQATNKVTRDYFLEGTKKGTSKKGAQGSKRYTTNETKKLLAEMIAAEARSTEMLKDLNRRIFEKFSSKLNEWNLICYCLAVIDVLLGLAEYTRNQSTKMCVPDVKSMTTDSPLIAIHDGIHPCVSDVDSFVPNDTKLGIDDQSPLLILTGPNMGGKSTLMRQVALLTIMAQIGCHVPATSMSFTCVDRIFTRLGAQDDIMAGQSTFLTELREASVILQHATCNSLVFLDELGRGTSTYDGTAIATAYVGRLVNIKCRTIFATHYHSLLEYFKGNSHIQLGHMACQVESDEDDVSQETVIFMYKLVSGACPKSYGFNAARLAGIPNIITNKANYMSQKLECDTVTKKIFQKILFGENIRKCLDSVCV